MTCIELLAATEILLKLKQMGDERYVILKADKHFVERVITNWDLPYHTIGWDSVGQRTLVEKKNNIISDKEIT